MNLTQLKPAHQRLVTRLNDPVIDIFHFKTTYTPTFTRRFLTAINQGKPVYAHVECTGRLQPRSVAVVVLNDGRCFTAKADKWLHDPARRGYGHLVSVARALKRALRGGTSFLMPPHLRVDTARRERYEWTINELVQRGELPAK